VSAPSQIRCFVALALLVGVPASRSVLVSRTWHPTSEDDGADTGPDPGTCEATRTCSGIPK
jgi:hypothetical protein